MKGTSQDFGLEKITWARKRFLSQSWEWECGHKIRVWHANRSRINQDSSTDCTNSIRDQRTEDRQMAEIDYCPFMELTINLKDNPTPEEISKLDEDIEDVYDQVENVVAFCPTDPSASTVKIYNEKILQIKKSSARVANKAEKWESKGLKNMEKLRGLLKTITEFEQRLGTYWQRIREALDKAEPTKEEMNISVSALEYFKRSRNQQTQAREDFSSWFNRSRSTAPPLHEISGRNVHGKPRNKRR
ncbi:hypothetical protein DERF_012464 [Dermatophagoides farinae]|uniref:Uncharacterized protein n=1 Tax=Dermatophagoides farinae TaxID=6954 RepID=A0A922HSL6_DERFA|nr:hypothetical protein DERF_012464 [Dermatophagoides farinae]